MADGAATTEPGVLNPRRPQLATALACVTNVAATEWAKAIRWGSPSRIELGERDALTLWAPCGPGRGSTLLITDPAEAWEALATRGVIPDAWVGDARRAFSDTAACYCDALEPDDGPCAGCRGIEQVRATPWTVAACVALASDVAGVTQAEALAREAVARLATVPPGDVPRPSRVVWRVVDAKTWRPNRRNEYLLRAQHWGRPTSWKESAEIYRRVRRRGAHSDAQNEAYWLAYCSARWVRSTRTAPDPFAPLVELWALGYALDAITDDAVVLVAPNLDSGEGR
jgi:hypothetical protein